MSERPVLTLTPAPDTRLADGNATGNVVYVFNLKFVSRFGVDQHFRMSSEGWGDHELLMVRRNPEPAPFLFLRFFLSIPAFLPLTPPTPPDVPSAPTTDETQDMMREHGRFFDRCGRIVANYVDDAPACTARKGDRATNVILRVPARDEFTADALIRDHQQLMRRTHHFTTQLDYDELRPRITQYQVSKHLAREDPWDTRSAPSGDVHYCFHTTFVDALGIRGHRNVAHINPEVYQRMTPFFLKYGVHADVENHAVFANMQRPNFVSNIIRGVGKLFVKTEQDVALQEFEARLNQPRL